jgi:predicted phage-related endonuclease
VRPELVDEDDVSKSLPVRLGNRLEPLVASLYAEETGRRLLYKKGWMFRHHKYPELICTPDRLVKGEKRVVEIKTESFKDRFGDVGTDQVPESYLCQVAHQLAVLDFDVADIALLHLPARLGIYPICRDKELEKSIVDRLREWWHTYVLAKREPPIDQSPTWARYIQAKFPKEQGEIIEVSEAATLSMIQELIDLRKTISGEDSICETLKNELRNLIGGNAGLRGGWGKITWKKSKDTTADVSDWETIAHDLAVEGGIDTHDFDRIVSKRTDKGVITRVGSRKFILTAKEQ